MVDNITLNSGSGGSVIATDDISSVHYQIIKLAYGALNTATLVTTSAPLPVDIRAENASVTVDNAGTFATQVDGDALTALQLIDNIVVVEDAQHGSGDSGVMALAVRNDTLAALAGTDGDYAPLQVNATGALFIQEGAAMDVSAATVTVDATGQGDVPITLGGEEVVLGTGSNTVGEVTIGAATTAAGDLAKAEDVAHSSGDVGVMGLAVRDDAPAAVSGTDGDYEPQHVSAEGGTWVKPMPGDYEVANNSKQTRKYYTATTPTDGIIWSPAAGTRWHVTSLYFNVSAAATVTFEDDKTGGDDPVLKGEFAANSGAGLYFGDHPMASTEDAADLTVTVSAGTIYVTAVGYEI